MTLEQFLPFFVLAVFVIIAVSVGSAVKAEKKKKKNNTSSGTEQPLAPARQQSEDPFFETAARNGNEGAAPVRKYVSPEGQTPARRDGKPRFVEGTDLVEAAPKVHTSAKVVGIARSHHDEHCDVEHCDEDLYIVEKVPVSGSIGGKSDEGCKEHYGLRFVKVDETETGSGKIEVSPDDIRKAIILGEVINDPAYKK